MRMKARNPLLLIEDSLPSSDPRSRTTRAPPRSSTSPAPASPARPALPAPAGRATPRTSTNRWPPPSPRHVAAAVGLVSMMQYTSTSFTVFSEMEGLLEIRGLISFPASFDHMRSLNGRPCRPNRTVPQQMDPASSSTGPRVPHDWAERSQTPAEPNETAWERETGALHGAPALPVRAPTNHQKPGYP